MRIVDQIANEKGVERIKATFDAVVADYNGPTYELPEAADRLRGQDGDFFYGINEEGVEGICVLSSMGPAFIYRDGSAIYPEGLEEHELPDTAGAYDRFYAALVHFMRPGDLPDKIIDPLADEIDVEAGFAAPTEGEEEEMEEEIMPPSPIPDDDDDEELSEDNE